ncbi:MAG: hypothetical protein H6834_05105 [Planctomycetes bacterium]|nr:hypothetical protein [Planctomycetota bacterium]
MNQDDPDRKRRNRTARGPRPAGSGSPLPWRPLIVTMFVFGSAILLATVEPGATPARERHTRPEPSRAKTLLEERRLALGESDRQRLAVEDRVRPIVDLARESEQLGQLQVAAKYRRMAATMLRGVQALRQADRHYEFAQYRAARQGYYAYLARVDALVLPGEREDLARAAYRIGECYAAEAQRGQDDHESLGIDLSIGNLDETPLEERLMVQPNEEPPHRLGVLVHGAALDETLRALAARGERVVIDVPQPVGAIPVEGLFKETTLDQAVEYLAGALGFAVTTTRDANVGTTTMRLHGEPAASTPQGRQTLLELALRAMDRAALRFPEASLRGRAHLVRGSIFEQLGQPERALAEYHSLTEGGLDDPHVPEARFRLAQAYETEGLLREARREYESIAIRHPESEHAEEALFRFAVLLHEDSDLRAAREYLGIYLELHPEGAHARSARLLDLEIELQQRLTNLRPADAEAFLARMERLAPDDRDVDAVKRYRDLAARMLETLGRRDEAVRHRLAATQEFRSDPDFAARMAQHAARILLEDADPLGALLALEQTHGLVLPNDRQRELDATWVRVYVALGLPRRIQEPRLLDPAVHAKDLLEAARIERVLHGTTHIWDTLLERADTHDDALLALARRDLSQDDPNALLERLQPAVDTSTNARFVTEAYRLMGDAWMALGEPEKAARCYVGVRVPTADAEEAR